MKFSHIIGHGFYGIILSQDDYSLIDSHYTASAHHRIHWNATIGRNDDLAIFHFRLHRAHLAHLMDIIYYRGSFVQADDRSLQGLDEKSGWNARTRPIPDPNMFDNFLFSDDRWGLGSNHAFDNLLVNLVGPVLDADKTDFYKLRLVANC
jgi:hypothetical protein